MANDAYSGGLVRQYGNLSFARVFQAGHEIPSYQPETAYRIFMRALFNKDISTGDQATYTNGEAYSSEGPSDTWATRNEDPPDPIHFCYILDPYTLCSDEQIQSIIDGSALIEDYIVVDQNSTQLFPGVVGNGTSSGNPSSGGSGYPSSSAYPPMQTGNEASTAQVGWLMCACGVAFATAMLM